MELVGVFFYVDFVNKKVVVFGDFIDCMVNVMVFDGFMGKRFVGVIVILGVDLLISC